ncbi:restriction endonuclease subunit S [Candidatus Methylospira mobilis]|uniref:Restriction endonuclease subunit S n=1 Tax=Candidatus Methylospira mobilis TaxID=1808979 RepID=A0A5Q0BQZ0_9GAMM|nr:restriction endonuclease subunit S [Candidatus Methylospira mobilis]QFY44614.1 restriction endonuclease subunit S [Candidatus Methylospira mobilis]
MIEQLAELPTYEVYKDSGVEWLGEIPAHWELSKLGTCLKPVSVKNRSDLPLLSITREKGVITRNLDDEDENHNFVPDDLSNYKVLEHGQFGINKMKAWQGSYGVSDFTGIVSPAYFIFAFAKPIAPKFFHLAIRSKLYTSFFGSASDGVRIGQWDLSKSRMKEIPFLIPSLPEQTAIAAFLNRKTAQIDQAVAIKEQQIALLKERKQILIQNAITRGFDPNVPMRDSGVEWIGEIPEHWEIKRAKYLFKEIDERSVSGEEELLSVSHMTGVTPRSEKNVTMFMAEDYTGSKTCQKGDLVFNIMWAWMGALGVSDRTGIVSSSYGVFRQMKNMFNQNYLEFLLKTTGYIEHYNKVSTGLHSSRLRFYSHMFFNMELGFPSKDEQDEIVAHIETQSAKIELAIAIQQQQIDKLKEYKATLINSAVTGKLKVTELRECKDVG